MAYTEYSPNDRPDCLFYYFVEPYLLLSIALCPLMSPTILSIHFAVYLYDFHLDGFLYSTFNCNIILVDWKS